MDLYISMKKREEKIDENKDDKGDKVIKYELETYERLSDNNFNIKNNNKNNNNKDNIINNNMNNINNNKNDNSKNNNMKINNFQIDKLFDITYDDLNEYPFSSAYKKDYRSCCQCYLSFLMDGNIVLNFTCNYSYYNLIIIKVGLILMIIPINLTFNTLFFTNKKIKALYEENKSPFYNFKHFLHIFLSFIFTEIVLEILKLLGSSHKGIKKLKKFINFEEYEKNKIVIQNVIKCITLGIHIYFILSFILLLIFGYYTACFCAIFQNTQKELIISNFESLGFTILYTFLIYPLSAIFRIIALRTRSKCLFIISNLLRIL